MKFYVKNMVCNRCIAAVEKVLLENDVTPTHISLGEVIVTEEINAPKKSKITADLLALGFEWLDDKKERMVEAVKNLIVVLIQNKDNELQINLSDYLSQNLHYEYTTISNVFSEVTGITIEKFYIAQKIEKVKEYLFYDELSLSEIADKLNYSSVAHLSAQFKKVTGMTPSQFKQNKTIGRTNLDKI